MVEVQTWAGRSGDGFQNSIRSWEECSEGNQAEPSTEQPEMYLSGGAFKPRPKVGQRLSDLRCCYYLVPRKEQGLASARLDQ